MSECAHYDRGCQIVALCCDKVFGCRLCHDEKSNHQIDRFATKEMVCKKCNTRQPVSNQCTNCSIKIAEYYCSICRLWTNDVEANNFHCDKCGVCNRAYNYKTFHCDNCGVCLILNDNNTPEKHRCFDRKISKCVMCGNGYDKNIDINNSLEVLPICNHNMHCKEWERSLCNLNVFCPCCDKSIIPDHLRIPMWERAKQAATELNFPTNGSLFIDEDFGSDREVLATVIKDYIKGKDPNSISEAKYKCIDCDKNFESTILTLFCYCKNEKSWAGRTSYQIIVGYFNTPCPDCSSFNIRLLEIGSLIGDNPDYKYYNSAYEQQDAIEEYNEQIKEFIVGLFGTIVCDNSKQE